jgi:hypothetical protein
MESKAASVPPGSSTPPIRGIQGDCGAIYLHSDDLVRWLRSVHIESVGLHAPLAFPRDVAQYLAGYLADMVTDSAGLGPGQSSNA